MLSRRSGAGGVHRRATASYTNYFGKLSSNPTDLAFALYQLGQTTVPEPSSLMLMGIGVFGATGMLRRKFMA